MSKKPEDTYQWASKLAHALVPGSIIALYGELGAGKTCFVQGLAAGLGIDQPITSPTYTLIHEYHGTTALYHIDLYRINSTEEALNLGLDEYLDGQGITAIEWAQRADSLIPPHTIHVYIDAGSEEKERIITIKTKT